MEDMMVKPNLVIFDLFRTTPETGEEIKTGVDDIIVINCSEILTISNDKEGFHHKILQNCALITTKDGCCYPVKGNARDLYSRILRS